MSYRGRFAPSPTGPLHFGSLIAAAGSFVRARSLHGTWLVRIEDIDPPREVPGASANILSTLAAFGMVSDEPVIYQSLREPAYLAAFDRLRSRDLVYPCSCSRTELQRSGGVHRNACVSPPSPDRPAAWRLRVDEPELRFRDGLQGEQSQALAHDAGDFVIRRVEGWFAYQLAVVVDDAQARISEVVRGSDLLDSTPRQIYLQQLLQLPTPQYLHLPLALDGDGKKISKSEHALTIDPSDPASALRAALNFLGLGFALRGVPSNVTALLSSAARHFDLRRLRTKSASCTAAKPGA